LYEVRKAKSVQMLSSGVEPVKDGFGEYYIPSQHQKRACATKSRFRRVGMPG